VYHGVCVHFLVFNLTAVVIAVSQPSFEDAAAMRATKAAVDKGYLVETSAARRFRGTGAEGVAEQQI
jgi:hypothetical protein